MSLFGTSPDRPGGQSSLFADENQAAHKSKSSLFDDDDIPEDKGDGNDATG
jgi:hypothetical protein